MFRHHRPLIPIVLALLSFSAGLAQADDGARKVRPKHKPPTWRGGGQRIPDVPRDQVICFALYTVHHSTLKLSAQLYPLKAGESRQVSLQIKTSGGQTTDGAVWKTIATSRSRG